MAAVILILAPVILSFATISLLCGIACEVSKETGEPAPATPAPRLIFTPRRSQTCLCAAVHTSTPLSMTASSRSAMKRGRVAGLRRRQTENFKIKKKKNSAATSQSGC